MKNPMPIAAAAVMAVLLALAHPTFAHSPICSCYDNNDGTVTCEGGFSDGASAEGVPIRILDLRERVLVDGKMDSKSTFTFKKPDQEFRVVFDAGQSHVVTIYSEDIE